MADAAAALLERFVARVAANGFTVHRGAAPAEVLAGAGVSVGLYGLAESGSVVLAAAPGEPRANSLLPDVHVTLLREDLILSGLPELFAALGGSLPSALAIVSGPSKSADIEQKLAVGVHGPSRLQRSEVPPHRLRLRRLQLPLCLPPPASGRSGRVLRRARSGLPGPTCRRA